MRTSCAFLLLVLAAHSAWSASWSLEVDYPDHEIKNFKVPPDEKLTIPHSTSSRWNCIVSKKIAFDGGVEGRTIVCSDSAAKTGAQLMTLCASTISGREKLTITEGDDAKATYIKLSCEP